MSCFILLSGGIAGHTACQLSRGSLSKGFADYTKYSYLHLAICHFLVALITSKDLLRSAKDLFISLPRLAKSRGS